MSPSSGPIVICGAGIAGIAAAYFLGVRSGVRDVVLIDERRPLSLTSDKSTEAYRNWWPGPDDAMMRLMDRSIDLLEELSDASDNIFHMNRRGYVYATADPARALEYRRSAEGMAQRGAGPLRIHDGSGSDSYQPSPVQGWRGAPEGVDLVTDRALIRRHFGFLAQDTVAVLNPRRCGWLSGQQLGMWMLEQARASGVRLISGRVDSVAVEAGRVLSVNVRDGSGVTEIPAGNFVDCAGPFAREVGQMIGMELPVFSERHLKIAFDDRQGAVPRDCGLVICDDPITLPWDEDERAELLASAETRWLAEPLPAGVHMRPEGHSEGSQTVLVLWPYHAAPHAEVFPVPIDADYAEVALRGMARLIPALAPYCQRLPKVYVDGGYYTKTIENRPLIGPLRVDGAYTLCALSGFGLMAACAAGELLAAHLTGAPLPDYAAAFLPSRYDDPQYAALAAQWGSIGQL